MEAHLPCPPLVDWLPALLGSRAPMILAAGAPPRRLRPVLRALRGLSASPRESGDGDDLLWITEIGGAPPPASAVTEVRRGGAVVELAWVPVRPLRELLGVVEATGERARQGQRRVAHLLGLGLSEVQQWSSVDPERIVVTVARARTWESLAEGQA